MIKIACIIAFIIIIITLIYSIETKKYKVSKSTLPNVGKGCFATRDIKKGEIIGYLGDYSGIKNDIKIQNRNNFKCDTDLYYVNSCTKNYNCDMYEVTKYDNDKQYSKVYYYSNKNIKKGNELLVNYNQSPYYIQGHLDNYIDC